MTLNRDAGATADRIYAGLLRAYPRRFRARFGPAMREVFVVDRAEAARRGRRALVQFWTITVVEALWYGAVERCSRANRWPLERSPMTHRRIAMRSAFTLDWRDACRALRATPVVTAIALLSLALGIGANTALFSILNGLVLKPLPVHEPDRLVFLEDGSWTNPIWEAIRSRETQLFDGAFAWSAERFNMADHGVTDFVDGAYVSGRMFDVLGIQAARGRTLTAADDRRDGGPSGPVVVISHGFWQRRFGGAADVVGRRISLESLPFTVVGVVPAGFFGPDVGRSCDVYVPIGDEALIRGKESYLDGRATWWLNVMARLKPGQSVDQANAILRSVQPQIRGATQPVEIEHGYLSDPLTLSASAGGRSPLRTRYQQPLAILLVVVGAVLLIACANIANLLLARATARRRELVVRLALGASRGRLARLLFVESVILAAGGAILGMIFARMCGALLVRQLTTATNTVVLDTSPDWRVLAFTSCVTVLTALIFGLAPALGVTRVAPNEALKEQSRSVSGDRRFGLRNALVVIQVALSLALVVAAGLFVRTFSSLVSAPLGINPGPLIAVELNVQQSDVPPDQRTQLFERLREAAASVPGVKSAAVSLIRPLSGQGWNGRLQLTGTELSDRQRQTWLNGVSPGWFGTMGMRLLGGRDLQTSDTASSPRVVVVNQTFANRFFGGQAVIDHDVTVGGLRPVVYHVVGIVTDAVYRSPREGVTPTLYVPVAQADRLWPNLTLFVETWPGERGSIERRLVDALGRVDARTAFTLHRYEDLVGAPMTQERLVAMLSAFFGGLALLLAGLGLYGLATYSVNRRRREIGVRMALGANPGGVVRLVLGRVGWLVAAGTAAGAGLSWWASKYIATSLLFHLEPRDPVTFASAALLLAVVGALAGWLPARRASRIDPTQVLREE